MPTVSTDVTDDRDDEEERTDPHIAVPKSQPASASAPTAGGPPPLRTSSVPQRAMPPARTMIGANPSSPASTTRTDPAMRATDPARPPILPVRPSTPMPALAADRTSEMPPTSSLTAAMLIPRPSAAPPAGRVSDPGGSGDPLRERLAQVEVQAAATRSIASRVDGEAKAAHARLDTLDPRIASIETTVNERVARIEAGFETARKALVAQVEERLSAGPRSTTPAPLEESDLGSLKSTLATIRHAIAEHERLFEARRARMESLETRIASVEGDPRMVELRRATESFDLRLRALERAQEAIRADVDARLATMEARFAEAPTTGTKKALSAAAEPELRRIKGVGPKYEKALREIGITTIAQVAAMGDEELARVATQMAVPLERIKKLGWPELARALLAE